MGNRRLRELQARVPWNRMLQWKGDGPPRWWKREANSRVRARTRALLHDVTRYDLDVCTHDPDKTVYPDRTRHVLDIWNWW